MGNPLGQGRSMTVPLVIEFAGIPGSGKSSLSKLVAANLRSEGHNARTVIDAARLRSAERGPGRILAEVLPGRLSRVGLWWLFYWAGTVRAVAHAWPNRRTVTRLAIHLWRRPISLRMKAHIAWWYLQLGGRRSFLHSSKTIDAVLFDDGYVHRSVALFSSPHERPAEGVIRSYIGEIPTPSAVVQVLASVDTCVARVMERGIWSHSRDMSQSELHDYLSNAEYVLGVGVAETRAMGIPVFTCSNDETELSEVASEMSRELTYLLDKHPGERSAS